MAVRKKVQEAQVLTALHKSRFAQNKNIYQERKLSFAIRIWMPHQKKLTWPVSSIHKKHYRDLCTYIPEAAHGIFNSHNVERVGWK